jgi:hypothetical protein
MNAPTLNQMAANVQFLKTQEAKQQQAHLLCLALIALLRGGRA